MSIQNGLLRERKEEIVVNAVRELSAISETEWVNLAQVGALIRKSGLKYGKLFPFLKSFANILEFQENYDLAKPVAFVRLKNKVL
ncbi:MAG: hypothetical protein HC803_01850 [Saprospiraceae bacterium]|nr:hypothetical protein [Saprospiraceae bacterium]